MSNGVEGSANPSFGGHWQAQGVGQQEEAVKARVYVTLKRGVLDPAGKAIASGLQTLGFDEVSDVRLGKYIEVEVSPGPDSKARLEAMCEQLLANTVIEDYSVELEG